MRMIYSKCLSLSNKIAEMILEHLPSDVERYILSITSCTKCVDISDQCRHYQWIQNISKRKLRATTEYLRATAPGPKVHLWHMSLITNVNNNSSTSLSDNLRPVDRVIYCPRPVSRDLAGANTRVIPTPRWCELKIFYSLFWIIRT